jgi:fructose-bisphosphate aldolase class I
MATHDLAATAKALVAPGRGIVAADESNATIGKRFKAINVENTEENRRSYRELLLTAKGAGQFVSGAILYDETLRQKTAAGVPFPTASEKEGIFAGIKVDTGAKALAAFPGETVTEGLDGLRERLAEYVGLGARFTKWRAVITIGAGIPTPGCIEANAHALARYAALAQEAGLVPIVEPEVLMDGDHTIERSETVTTATLEQVFGALYRLGVVFEHMLLKPSMVIAGKGRCRRASSRLPKRPSARCGARAVRRSGDVPVGWTGPALPPSANVMNTLQSSLPRPSPRSRAPDEAPRRGLERREMGAAQKAYLHRVKCGARRLPGNIRSRWRSAPRRRHLAAGDRR